MENLSRVRRALVLSGLQLAFCALFLRAQNFPGGFVEKADTVPSRPPPTTAQIQSFLPLARGKFTFPAPYNTAAVRITDPSDCAGATDCVFGVGYSYWRVTNNHVSSSTILIVVGLNKNAGGAGPSLFSYDKLTDQVAKLGPLFPPSHYLTWAAPETWYFSATQPHMLYIPDGSDLRRYDVVTKQFQTAFSVSGQFPGKTIFQAHSSNDDKVHSATLKDPANNYDDLGCIVFSESTGQLTFYPKKGTFDECQVDKGGNWLLIKEDVDGLYGTDNRIIDLRTGAEKTLLDQDGATGHSDNGYGYQVGHDNWDNYWGVSKLWKFADNPMQGTRVYYTNPYSLPSGGGPAHIAHGNAKAGVPPDQQYACGSNADTDPAKTHSNEILCFRLDTSNNFLIVAPVMVDLNGPGGSSSYARLPKGNLDVTGQYFVWGSNMAGSGRKDIFLVKVPSQLLTGGASPAAAPPAKPKGLRIR
ncbi:MAG: hypothetical protein A3J74_00875 [Elusimicrobia bacterium RIFCSPHIGHO2_02_FULL_57_9]|nr:MAG: hypothetical protein A3J74_00875 [Elusimicrobia bacterium RIFCSPHIGHO2_02_FULL_57_9]